MKYRFFPFNTHPFQDTSDFIFGVTGSCWLWLTSFLSTFERAKHLVFTTFCQGTALPSTSVCVRSSSLTIQMSTTKIVASRSKIVVDLSPFVNIVTSVAVTIVALSLNCTFCMSKNITLFAAVFTADHNQGWATDKHYRGQSAAVAATSWLTPPITELCSCFTCEPNQSTVQYIFT